MSKEYSSALQAQVEQFLKDKGISQTKAAPMMGISQTALSQYRRSMYDNGDIAALESKLEEFFRTQQEQEASTERAMPYRPIQDYIPTSISEDVYKMIRYCQLEKGMAIIYGDAGVGKTKGAEKFVRENPSSSVYIQASPSTGTLGNFLRVLAAALRVPETRNQLSFIQAIREKLDGTNKIVIIDEAQHLQLSTLDEIKNWTEPNYMLRQSGTGIALIGNTKVYTRMVGRQEADFSQLFSRVRLRGWYPTEKVTKEDVEKLFSKLTEDGRTKELAFLHGICRSKWGIRGAVNIYNNAVNNEDISHEGLYGMARTMGIGLV